MPTDVLVLVAVAVVALVALAAAVVAVGAARRTARDRAELRELVDRLESASDHEQSESESALLPVPLDHSDALVLRDDTTPADLTRARVVEGQVFVIPTQQELVATALSRPATRLTVVVHGLAHALRPESRDRIAALMRRELTRRRRERRKAARHAARVHRPSSTPGTEWIGTAQVER